MKRIEIIVLIGALCLVACRKSRPGSNEAATVTPEIPSVTDSTENRPDDLELAMKGVAEWKVSPDEYYSEIDLELLEQSPESFPEGKIEGMVRMYAVLFDGKIYEFGEEDMKKVRFTGLRYNPVKDRIEFRLEYNGVTGKDILVLPFGRAGFYAGRFQVRTAFVESHFLEGIHHYAGAFLEELLLYDTDRYLPELYSKGIDRGRNSMSVTFTVCDRSSGKDLGVRVTKDFSGFRSQDELLRSVNVYPTYTVCEMAAETMRKYTPDKDLKKYLEPKVINRKWMRYMEYAIGGVQLYYTAGQTDAGSRGEDVISGKGDRMDVYLSNPLWQVESAGWDGKTLKLRMRLKYVNGSDVSGISYEIQIPAVL